jgi:hypothetical protein
MSIRTCARLAGVMLLAVAASCSDKTADVLGPATAPTNDIFKSYVSVGNSITAGWQSDGINDSTQKQSYAYLLAQQMHTRFAYPSFAKPGCTPPIANWVTQKRIDSLAPVPNGCAFRDPTKNTDILNNVAVAGTYAVDLTSQTVYTAPSALFTLALGGLSQVQKALQADPTFLTVWVGNNEILGPASTGLLVATPGVPGSGLPSKDVWIPQYAAAINQLKAGAPNLKGGVLIGVVDVVNVPRFFPADTLGVNATFKSQFDQLTGKTNTIIGCGASGYLISTEIISRIRSGAVPAVVSCAKNQPQPPLGDIFMIDPAEKTTLSAAVADYNTYIKAKADTLGFAYFDPNPALAQLRAAKAVPVVPALLSTNKPFGDYISLDGAHPSALAHKLIANALIDVINAKYSASLAKIP